LERAVHRTLLGGVILCGVLLVFGLTIALTQHQPQSGTPPTLRELFRAALSGNGPAIIDLGIVVLMLTPFVRVAVLAVGWMLAGDRRFAAVALVVLGLLGLSLILGLG
jgi:uncharacterized membrane protein